MTKLHTSRRD